MKHIRNLCPAIALLFVLTLSAQAGEMTTWGVAPPPPPPPPASVTSTDPGDITIWGAPSTLDSEPFVTELTLSILLAVF